MRIAYNNLLDALSSDLITPLTETTLYEATKVQDQRRTTQWWTTSATDQTIIFDASSATIVGGNIGLVTGSAATNLTTDPENIVSANWGKSNVGVTSSGTILGMRANKITASVSAFTTYVAMGADAGFAASSASIAVTIRKGNVDTALVYLRDTTAGTNRIEIGIVFSTKVITYTTGTEGIPAEWIDDDTVRIYANTVEVVAGNDNMLLLYARDGAGTIGDYTYYTAAMVINNTYPVPYVATSRTAVDTSYAFRLPPSGKFIVDFEFFPYFAYNVSASRGLFGWYPNATSFLTCFYDYAVDKIKFAWKDGTNLRTVETDAFVASTLNTYKRVTLSADLTVATTSNVYLYIDGVLMDSAWSDTIDVLSASTLTSLGIGDYGTSQYADGIFRFARVYGSNLSATTATAISSDATLNTALADHTLLFDQTYQNQFNFDTVAILGHNISEGAQITFQANDYNEWNYTDGSGSSIIQETLTWDESTILKMITKTKKQYIKFTINDPNNDDGLIKIGRIWAGPYITINPSSLDDFTVTKKRSDDRIYGKNRQKWSNENVGWREFNLRFPRTASTTLNAIQTMYDTVGNHSSLIFMNFDTLRSWPIVEPMYGSINGELSFSHRGRQKYQYSLSLEEDL